MDQVVTRVVLSEARMADSTGWGGFYFLPLPTRKRACWRSTGRSTIFLYFEVSIWLILYIIKAGSHTDEDTDLYPVPVASSGIWAPRGRSNEMPPTPIFFVGRTGLESKMLIIDVPTCRRSTIGGRAFPVAGAKVWNGLPSDVTSAYSLSVFKNRLNTYLFRRCYEIVLL